MSSTSKKIVLSGVFLFTYGLLFYFLLTSQLRLDFSSFYSSAVAFMQGKNPYQCFIVSFYKITSKLPANLNPPFFLFLISPLTQFNFKLASALWIFGSFILGIIGALLSFKLSCSTTFYKKNRLFLLFIYLGMFATLMTTSLGQVGSILLFFIMGGYYLYLLKKDYLAGILWGVIISIKLFPALLFLFVLMQKRYRVFFVMLATCFLAFLVPYLLQGADPHTHYFTMLQRILWFGDNWNGSFYGFLFRLFVNVKYSQNVWTIKLVYLFFSLVILLWYIKRISFFIKTTHNDPALDHRGFCFTLVMMLLLSPLGWLYYFPLLLMPLTVIWQSLGQQKSAFDNTPLLWILSLILVNLPFGYVDTPQMHSIYAKLSLYSCYFYGLLLIAYLLNRLKAPSRDELECSEEISMSYVYPLNYILALGLFITLCCFIVKLMD